MYLFFRVLHINHRLQSAATDILVVQGDYITLYFDTRPAVITMVRWVVVLLYARLLSRAALLMGNISLNILSVKVASVSIPRHRYRRATAQQLL